MLKHTEINDWTLNAVCGSDFTFQPQRTSMAFLYFQKILKKLSTSASIFCSNILKPKWDPIIIFRSSLTDSFRVIQSMEL